MASGAVLDDHMVTIEDGKLSSVDAWKAAQRIPPWVDARDLPASRRYSDPFAEFDYLGRKVPHRLGLPFWLLTVARIDPARVRRVPATAIADEGEDEFGAFADVVCPCGARPVVRAELAKCAHCERYYSVVGHGAVYVTYGAMAPPALPSDAPAPPPPC